MAHSEKEVDAKEGSHSFSLKTMPDSGLFQTRRDLSVLRK